jgi:hypothetical protein
MPSLCCFVLVTATVDSGADCSIVPAEIGELLGIDIEMGRQSDVGGIAGTELPFFLHQVTLRVGGCKHEVSVGLMVTGPLPVSARFRTLRAAFFRTTGLGSGIAGKPYVR